MLSPYIHRLFVSLFILSLLICIACSDSSSDPDMNGEPDPDPNENQTESLGYPDDYSQWAEFSQRDRWGPYNLHDPSCIKEGDQFYCFSTDVGYGLSPLPQVGVMVRRSGDLVNWDFLGWAFNGIPQAAADYVTQANDGEPPSNIWAPYIMKSGDTFRLYYSVSVFGSDASYIGLATSQSPEGPWEQQGAVVTTTQDDPMNAIDPTVVVDRESGEHWLAYGSHFAGLYMLQLDSATGKPLEEGDTGFRIARNETSRIEAPELVYNEDHDKYYLFVSYGDLSNNYNVRVGRADRPEGPYLDWNGRDMSEAVDNKPVLTSSYRFDGHSGWQGMGHCGVFSDGTNFFMMNQGRLGADPALMVMHVRQLYWTDDGWPVASSERYVGLEQQDITADSVAGSWEHLKLHSFADGHDTKNESVGLSFESDGTVTGNFDAEWRPDDKTLTITKSDETLTLFVRHGYDWEHNKRTLIYTGFSEDGISIWGKRVE